MNEVINMKDVTEKIKDQVKVSFFELLPDKKFAELVDVEIRAFFEATSKEFSIADVDKNYYKATYKLNTPISPFRMIVWEKCKKIVEKKMENVLTEEGLSVSMGWNEYGDQKASLSVRMEELLKKQTIELASSFFSRMFAEAFTNAEYNLKENIKNDIVSNMNNGY